MLDLKLNYNGDITFEETDINRNSININFTTSITETLSINFYINNMFDEDESIQENSLVIKFDIYNLNYNKKCTETIGNEYIEQCIRIRLETVIDTIKGQEGIGSYLDEIKHEYIDNSNIENNIKNILKNALEDILPNIDINIKVKQTKYLDYSSGFIAEFIYDQGKYIHKF